MVIVKYILGLAALGAITLAMSLGALSVDGGMKLMVVLGVPLVATAVFSLRRQSLPRWASGLSLLCFLLAAMWTTEAPFDDVMMLAALGLVLSLVLLIRPDRPGA